MSVTQWARGRGEEAERRGLRRGEWYRVLEDQGAGWLLLDVKQAEVRITREHLQVRAKPPTGWSVVRLTLAEAAREAAKHGHPNDEAHQTYGVCPACQGRQHIAGQPQKVRCDACGKTFSVDWKDSS